MSKKLSVVLTTTLSLLDQFQDAVQSATQNPASNEVTGKDALPLLTASSNALKSQVTKLSLLTITPPFTPSAVCTVLSALNESVLPSLVTGALLVTPNEYTKAFHSEIQILTKTALKELSSLIGEVNNVAEKFDKSTSEGQKKEDELSKPEKDVVTVATGRVWDSCDTLIDIGTNGVVGFVIRRVEQWRDLVRDAVEEIEEWDPDEDGDGFFDDILGDDAKQTSGNGDTKDSDEEDSDDDDDGEDKDTATSHANKKSALRILKPVAQVYPAIVANRLKKAGNAPMSSNSGARKLESLMANLQSIPQDIDEVAGALYEANWGKFNQFRGKVKDDAAKAVNLVALPWDAKEEADGQKTEDKFTVWSKTWLKVMDQVSKSIDDDATNSK